MESVELANLSDGFRERLRADRTTLSRCRETLRGDSTSSGTLVELLSCAHKLAGAAGIFGFQKVSSAAAALEERITDGCSGRNTSATIGSGLDALVDCIEREQLLQTSGPIGVGFRQRQPTLQS
jgi:HPt (histidine-containing phosphotransfer) domain-containing protein